MSFLPLFFFRVIYKKKPFSRALIFFSSNLTDRLFHAWLRTYLLSQYLFLNDDVLIIKARLYSRHKWCLLFQHWILCVKKDRKTIFFSLDDSHSTKQLLPSCMMTSHFLLIKHTHTHGIGKENKRMIKMNEGFN